MEKLVIVIEDGLVRNVYGSRPNLAKLEVIDLDFNGSEPEVEEIILKHLKKVEQEMIELM